MDLKLTKEQEKEFQRKSKRVIEILKELESICDGVFFVACVDIEELDYAKVKVTIKGKNNELEKMLNASMYRNDDLLEIFTNTAMDYIK